MSRLPLAILSLLTALLALPENVAAQVGNGSSFSLEGSWSGAYVRGSAVQSIRAQIDTDADSSQIVLNNEDWAFWGRPSPANIVHLEDGRMAFDTHLGRAVVIVDSTHSEIIGTIGSDEPAFKIHLKKAARRPLLPVKEATVSFESGDVELSGTLVTPEGSGPFPAVVYVAGRGCASRSGGLNRLRWLARYGIAGLAYDNRGAGESTGSCKRSTLESESRDIRSAIQQIANADRIDRERIGLWGNSAAGWYIPHAVVRSTIPVAFVITQVGPTTSVEQQQTDNARYIAAETGMSDRERSDLLRYVELTFSEELPNDEVFAEMMELLGKGREDGWANEFLVTNPEVGDIPATAEGLDSLWARRYDYDPSNDLSQLDMPFMALFGENDRVTPPAENVPLFRHLMADNDHARAVILPNVRHGQFVGERLRALPSVGNRSPIYYWKFARISGEYQHQLIDFLDEYVFSDN